MIRRILTIVGFLAVGIAYMSFQDGASFASGAEPKIASAVQYRLSFRQAESHRVDIELSVPTDGKAQIELMMPVWTPGSYLVREYARQIEQISAADGTTNQSLQIVKKDKNHWTVDCPNASEVWVRYSLYCREMSVRTNWVERDFSFLTGAATFLTRSDMLKHPHIVRIDALPHWPNIATSLPATDSRDPWTRTAKNFDELVDSPIVLGLIDIQTFESGGAKHHLATLGAESFWDTAAAVKDVAKIVETEQKFWGSSPYQEYWFLNLATESGGGLEHDNSCVLMTGRWTQRQKSKYIDWLGLVSHEFFHTWNVRRLRPKALKEYDYNQEQYFQELWIAEGLTSYYDDLFVARTGLSKPKDYLERLSKNIASVQNAPGRLKQSLTESSFDSWIKFYRPDENASNSRISYYLKGALVGLLLDVEIRSVTQDTKSLDNVMQLLWNGYRDTGYTNENFSEIVKQVTGQSFDLWLKKTLETTDELDFSKLLEWYGLEWKSKEPDKDPPGGNPAFGNVYVGLDLKSDQGKAMIDKVTLGSPASNAGFNAGDELLGFDGFRVSADGWTERLNLYKPNDAITCLIARRGKLVELTLKLAAQPENSWNLVRVAKPTEEQEKHWRSWLALPEPEPENKPGLDSLPK
jgi:predicted metalloprotease with PDZ domain